jgi:hypothetical protein
MSNKLSFITDNGPDFLNNIRIKEKILLSRRFDENLVFSFDFNKITNDRTRLMLVYTYFHNMNSLTYFLKYWLVFNNNGPVTETDTAKEAAATYKKMVAVATKFHDKYRSDLSLDNLTAFIETFSRMSQETVKFDLDGLDEKDVAYLYAYFKRNNAFNLVIDNDSVSGFGELSTFAGVYVLNQFWEGKDDSTARFNRLTDNNSLDRVRRTYNNDNVRAFFLDLLNVYTHKDEPVFGQSLQELQTSLENFAYSPQTTLRRLAILTDRSIVDYFVSRLEEIKDPDEAQKAALIKYKFYQERISAKYYKNIFTPESIAWYKAFLTKYLLGDTKTLQDQLPDKLELYAFLDKKFNLTDPVFGENPFLPNLIRGAQVTNFNFTDAPNIFIFTRLYSAIANKQAELQIAALDKAPASTDSIAAENKMNSATLTEAARINCTAGDLDNWWPET